MNNDYHASKANHSSMSSNNPIAKRISSNHNKRNNPNYLNINQENSPNKNNKFSKKIKYSNNIGQIRSPYQEEIVTGYYINSGDDERYINKNGKEDEIDVEDNINMENGEEKDNLNDGFIGDGEFVRYDMTNKDNYNNNNNNDYSPNQNGQDIYAYYNLRNINNNLNNLNSKKKLNKIHPKEDYEKNEEENKEDYLIESPEKNHILTSTNYNNNYNNNNNKIYQKRRVYRNLKDSASSEAYANKSNTRST